VAGASAYLAQLFALTWAGSQVTKVCPTACWRCACDMCLPNMCGMCLPEVLLCGPAAGRQGVPAARRRTCVCQGCQMPGGQLHRARWPGRLEHWHWHPSPGACWTACRPGSGCGRGGQHSSVYWARACSPRSACLAVSRPPLCSPRLPALECKGRLAGGRFASRATLASCVVAKHQSLLPASPHESILTQVQ